MKNKIKNRPGKPSASKAPGNAALPYIGGPDSSAAPASPSQPGLGDVTEAATVVMQPVVTPAPKPGDLIVRSGSVAGTPGQIVSAANRWRENYNPLRGLNMPRAVELLELGQRGDYAYLQWAYRFCERRNPTLSGLLSRCEAPLMGFPWSILKTTMLPTGADRETLQKKLKAKNRSARVAPMEADGLDAYTFRAMAEKQKRTLESAYNAIDNLRKALLHLHLADFRGYAHLQKHRSGDGDVTHLECLDQWCICRDGLNGNWFWNPDSRSTSMPLQFLGLKYCIGGPSLPLKDFIIREVPRPIDEIGIVNTVRRALVEKDYDAFIEIYGIPSGVAIMPPGVPVGKEADYERMARLIAEGGSGALPNGSDYKPNTLSRGQDPFNPRLDNLDASLVLAGTGGKLTMLVEHSAGQQRGNSRIHDQTFGEISNGRAGEISELMQINFDAEVLAKYHPGEPPLVYFFFGSEEEADVDGLCANTLSLKQAGKNVNTEFLSEKTGYEFDEDTDVDPDPGDPATQDLNDPNNPEGENQLPQNGTRGAKARIQNRTLKTGLHDVAAEIAAALAPVMVRLKKITALTDADSQKAALEKLAKDFPALSELILADHGVSKTLSAALVDSLGGAA